MEDRQANCYVVWVAGGSGNLFDTLRCSDETGDDDCLFGDTRLAQCAHSLHQASTRREHGVDEKNLPPRCRSRADSRCEL